MLAQSLEWLMQPPNLKIQFQWIINSYFLQEHDMENNDQHWCGLKILMDWGIDSEKASWWVFVHGSRSRSLENSWFDGRFSEYFPNEPSCGKWLRGGFHCASSSLIIKWVNYGDPNLVLTGYSQCERPSPFLELISAGAQRGKSQSSRGNQRKKERKKERKEEAALLYPNVNL